MRINNKVAVKNIVHTTIEFNHESLVKILKEVNLISEDVPDDSVEISMHVPGGGDWSNTTLSLSDSPLAVNFSQKY